MSLMNSRSKVLILFFIIIVYFSIVSIIFLYSIKFPSNISIVNTNESNNFSNLITYFNPYNLNLKNTSSVTISSGDILESHIDSSFISIRDKTVLYYIHNNWQYTINSSNIFFRKDNVLVYYKDNNSITDLEVFIPNKFKISKISSLFSTNYNIYAYPFNYSQMVNVLNSLTTTSTPNIEVISFQFFKNNFNNVVNFTNNTPIEEIKGVSIIDTSSQTSINSLLNSYISRFNSWGYIPFTVYGSIIDNNTIYYLKYNLGGVSLEVSVKAKNNYSLVYYTAKVSASAQNNNLSLFNNSGWNSIFN